MAAFVLDIVGTGFERDVHQPLFGGRVFFDQNLALAFEHPAHRARLAHVAAALAERMPNFAHRAIAVVGSDFHHHGRPARTVALIHDFVDLHAL